MLKPRRTVKRSARASIITRNLDDISDPTGNIYESLAIISKRANQVSVKIKDELNQKIADFATTIDNLEEIHENREQIEISKHYERQPKPCTLAIEEFFENKIGVIKHENEEG